MNSEISSQSTYWNNEAQSFQAIYSHDKSGLSNLLDRLFRQDMYDRFIFTMQHCSPVSGRAFLDVGCGSGLYSIELARKGASSVVGIDIAENMLHLCRQSADKAEVQDRCTFLHSDLLQFHPNRSFDAGIGIGLFDYIRDPLPVLKKMKEICTDRVIVSFPRLWTWRAPVRKARLSLRGCPVYFYSREKVSSLMEEAGFKKMEIHKVGKLFCVIGYSR
jgi:ubiquinone/menaquinone biosynthesis C-methylase UbiE